MKLTDLKTDNTVFTDCGFTCMSAGPKTIRHDEIGGFYVDCDEGRHFLDGQIDDADGELVGIGWTPEKADRGDRK